MSFNHAGSIYNRIECACNGCTDRHVGCHGEDINDWPIPEDEINNDMQDIKTSNLKESAPKTQFISRDKFGVYAVTFINEKGDRVEKRFDSPYLCRKFANRVRHSKRCKLIFVSA